MTNIYEKLQIFISSKTKENLETSVASLLLSKRFLILGFISLDNVPYLSNLAPV